MLKFHGLFASERFGKSHIIKRHFETKLAHGISFIGRLAAKIDIYFFPTYTFSPIFFKKNTYFAIFLPNSRFYNHIYTDFYPKQQAEACRTSLCHHLFSFLQMADKRNLICPIH